VAIHSGSDGSVVVSSRSSSRVRVSSPCGGVGGAGVDGLQDQVGVAAGGVEPQHVVAGFEGVAEGGGCPDQTAGQLVFDLHDWTLLC
jgi:hypothetical protein